MVLYNAAKKIIDDNSRWDTGGELHILVVNFSWRLFEHDNECTTIFTAHYILLKKIDHSYMIVHEIEKRLQAKFEKYFGNNAWLRFEEVPKR
jgi:hypothetical protein